MEKEYHVMFMETLLPFSGIIFLIALGVVVLTQQFRKNLYREQLENEELKRFHQMELVRSSILVQEQERKRIAQDIHDDLGAVLSIIKMHLLQTERKYIDIDAQLPLEIQNVRKLTENVIENMRRVSHELMPPQLEKFGVVQTLEQMCLQLTNSGKIRCEFSASESMNSEYSNDELLQVTLYRICMELINNTIKHAGATSLNLSMTFSGSEIRVAYRDDGKGILPGNTAYGAGLKNIQSRVSLLEGNIFLEEGPGFSAVIEIPFHLKNSLLAGK